MYNLVADVERKLYDGIEGYIYTIALKENKKIKTAPATRLLENESVQFAGKSLSDDTVSQPEGVVKSQNEENDGESSARLKGFFPERLTATPVDSKAVREAVKSGEAVTDDGYSITVSRGAGSAYTVSITKDGKTYAREGEASESLKGADIERTTAALLRNIKRGTPNSRSTSTAGIYHEKGENPARDVNVPIYDRYGKKVERFMRTVAESGKSDEMAEEVINSAIDGAASYTPVTNKSAMNFADEIVENDITQAHVEWERAVNGNKLPTPLSSFKTLWTRFSTQK